MSMFFREDEGAVDLKPRDPNELYAAEEAILHAVILLARNGIKTKALTIDKDSYEKLREGLGSKVQFADGSNHDGTMSFKQAISFYGPCGRIFISKDEE